MFSVKYVSHKKKKNLNKKLKRKKGEISCLHVYMYTNEKFVYMLKITMFRGTNILNADPVVFDYNIFINIIFQLYEKITQYESI